MARLTMEDKWWIDPRRSFLQSRVGDGADGLMIQVWRIAQEYFGAGTLIPMRVFSKFKNFQDIIDSDLAEVRDGPELSSSCVEQSEQKRELFVYVRGSKEFFTWILDIREVRREAGVKSAKARALKYGTAQPGNTEKPPKPRTNAEQNPTKSNKPEVSDSDSDSGFKNSYTHTREEFNLAKVEDLRLRHQHEVQRLEVALAEVFDNGERKYAVPPTLKRQHFVVKMLMAYDFDLAMITQDLNIFVREGPAQKDSWPSYLENRIKKRVRELFDCKTGISA